ncbi:MAG: tripartite tricarboxylate transporter TctB family protein [Spirochaetales bacterium]|nr:tripartite tricarboxylate transporter TctB family protein [Spirochaetales bacterium]
MQKQEYKIDIGVGAVAIVIGVAAFVLSLEMPGRASLFPKLVSALFCILGLSLILTSYARIRSGSESTKPLLTLELFKGPVMVFAILIAYVVVMVNVGFYVTTPFMLILYMRLLGIRSWRTVLLVTVIVMLFIFGLFSFALDIPLPEGFLR